MRLPDVASRAARQVWLAGQEGVDRGGQSAGGGHTAKPVAQRRLSLRRQERQRLAAGVLPVEFGVPVNRLVESLQQLQQQFILCHAAKLLVFFRVLRVARRWRVSEP